MNENNIYYNKFPKYYDLDDIIYNNKNNIKNDDIYFNHDKEMEIPDYAFFLSYGENGGYVPVGTFACTGCVDENKQKITGKKPIDLSKVYIELSEFKVEEKNKIVKKTKSEKIYIPILKMKQFIEKHALKNCNELLSMLGEQLITPELMTFFHEEVSKYLMDNSIRDDEINFTGESLEELGATLVSTDGDERIVNYTVMPFSFSEPRALVRDRYRDSDGNKSVSVAALREHDTYSRGR